MRVALALVGLLTPAGLPDQLQRCNYLPADLP